MSILYAHKWSSSICCSWDFYKRSSTFAFVLHATSILSFLMKSMQFIYLISVASESPTFVMCWPSVVCCEKLMVLPHILPFPPADWIIDSRRLPMTPLRSVAPHRTLRTLGPLLRERCERPSSAIADERRPTDLRLTDNAQSSSVRVSVAADACMLKVRSQGLYQVQKPAGKL